MNIQQVNALPPINCSVLGIDIETTQTISKKLSDPYRDRIISVQVSDGETVWVLQDGFRSLIPTLVNPEIKKISHNSIFDFSFLNKHLGVESVNLYDTLLAERVLNTGMMMNHGLKDVLARRFGVFLNKDVRDQFADHIGKLTHEQLEYAAADAYWLPKLREEQLKDISKAGLGKIVGLENSIIPVWVDMTLTGVGFDRELWGSHKVWIARKLEEIQLKMVEYLGLPRQLSAFGGIGMALNLNSRDQVLEILKKRGINLPDYQEGTIIAASYKHNDPFLADLLEYKKWEKMSQWGNPKHVNPITGRIHAQWNPVKADTGRPSSSKPALQNVIRPEENAPNFRQLFIPRDGYSYIVADFAQQEIRILAGLSNDEGLIEATRAGDIYAELATRVYKKPITKKDHERFLMKTGLLSHFYRISDPSLAGKLGVPLEDVQAFRRIANSMFPKARAWGDQQVSSAMNRGFTTTAWGRRRYYPEAAARTALTNGMRGRIEREAVNAPVQGSAADSSKEAMRLFWQGKRENSWDAHIVLVIHDELVVEVRTEIAEEIKHQVIGAMKTGMEAVCPNIVAGVDADVMRAWEKL